MDLLAVADFDLVATHGGFSRASRMAARPKATLARRVGELETSLGIRLLERGSRGLRLTETSRSGAELSKTDLPCPASAASPLMSWSRQPGSLLSPP